MADNLFTHAWNTDIVPLLNPRRSRPYWTVALRAFLAMALLCLPILLLTQALLQFHPLLAASVNAVLVLLAGAGSFAFAKGPWLRARRAKRLFVFSAKNSEVHLRRTSTGHRRLTLATDDVALCGTGLNLATDVPRLEVDPRSASHFSTCSLCVAEYAELCRPFAGWEDASA